MSSKQIQPQTLVAMGLLSGEQMEAAEETAAAENYSDVLKYLRQTKVIGPIDLHAAWARENEVDFIDLEARPVPEDLVPLVPAALARRHAVVPVALADGVLHLASSEPTDPELRAVLAGALPRYTVRMVYASSRAILNATAAAYSADNEAAGIAVRALAREEQVAVAREVAGGALGLLAGSADDEDVARVIKLIIEEAVRLEASDIHLDPQEENLMIRYRVDGILRDASTYARQLAPQLISRVKVLSSMRIDQREVPQDGRLSTTVDGVSYDLRVATSPAVNGEKITLRLLNNETSETPLESLGFGGDNLTRYKRCFTRPNGLILLTGPTGSGKTTTLYSTLNQVATREVNVMTVEDPVEIRVSGINQVQVDPAVGRTFPSVLRSFLRNDPDVILVGEVRDGETAKIAVDASLTGHLVFSTLHTNDAPSAVVRLIQMGVEPHLVSSALTCVLAQRLTRRLCAFCKVPVELRQTSSPIFADAGLYVPEDDDERPVFAASGCGRCSNTGFKGRVAIHEVMEVTDKIKALASESAPSLVISEAAKGDGMTTLLADGWSRVLQGVTTADEVLRVAAS